MLSLMISQLKRLHLLKIMLVVLICIDIQSSETVYSAAESPQSNDKVLAIQAPPNNEATIPNLQAVSPSSDLSAYESIEVMATGYTAGVESTGKSSGHPQYGITYSGVKVRKDKVSTIAADTKVFPLGTLLYIPGYGYGLVADTGSAIKGNKIDLFFLNKKEVYAKWGKKKVHVYVLKRGAGKVTEAMLDQLNEMEAFTQHPPIMRIK